MHLNTYQKSVVLILIVHLKFDYFTVYCNYSQYLSVFDKINVNVRSYEIVIQYLFVIQSLSFVYIMRCNMYPPVGKILDYIYYDHVSIIL